MAAKKLRYRLPLANAPVEGRLDVLAYKTAERYTKVAEAKYGLTGLWEAISRDTEVLIRGLLPKEKITIPPALKILLARMEAAQTAREQGKVQQT